MSSLVKLALRIAWEFYGSASNADKETGCFDVASNKFLIEILQSLGVPYIHERMTTQQMFAAIQRDQVRNLRPPHLEKQSLYVQPGELIFYGDKERLDRVALIIQSEIPFISYQRVFVMVSFLRTVVDSENADEVSGKGGRLETFHIRPMTFWKDYQFSAFPWVFDEEENRENS